MLTWLQTWVATFAGAFFAWLPIHIYAVKRRRKLPTMDPTAAIRYALAAHGLEVQQIADIMRRHDDEVRETYRQTYWTVLETLAAPSREGWELGPDGTAQWKPDA